MERQDELYEEELEQEAKPKEGRRLDARLLAEPIRNLPRRPAPVAVPLGTSIGEAARIMREHHVGCVLVEDAGLLVGIFTERDILTKLVGTGYDPARVTVDAVMTPDPERLTPEDPIAFALQRMSVGGYRHVPLVDGTGRPVGVLSVKDIVDYLVEQFPREVLNIPPEPGRHVRSAEGA